MSFNSGINIKEINAKYFFWITVATHAQKCVLCNHGYILCYTLEKRNNKKTEIKWWVYFRLSHTLLPLLLFCFYTPPFYFIFVDTFVIKMCLGSDYVMMQTYHVICCLFIATNDNLYLKLTHNYIFKNNMLKLCLVIYSFIFYLHNAFICLPFCFS